MHNTVATENLACRPKSATVTDWLTLFASPDDVLELRAVGNARAESGYFDHDHLAEMAAAALRLSADTRFKGVYFTYNPVPARLLERSPNSISPLRKGGGTSDTDVSKRNWLLIDIDPCRPSDCSATDGEKVAAKRKAEEVKRHLASVGWPEPVVADSGNGYHLLYKVDLPAQDDGLVKRTLSSLARRFDAADVKIDTSVFNPARLTKVYGTTARKGDPTSDRPHRASHIVDIPTEVVAVTKEQLEALAGPNVAAKEGTFVGGNGTCGQGDVPVIVLAEKLARARSYVAEMPAAVEGRGGDKATYAVACRLVIDFGLSVEESLPLMQEYNNLCQPTWPTEDLRRKLEKADEQPGQRGSLLCQKRTSMLAVAADAPPFPVSIPDFMMWDVASARPATPLRVKDARGRMKRLPAMPRSWLLPVLHYALITQRRLPVTVPDVILGSLVWGARTLDNPWPANWRRTLQADLTKPPLQSKDCPPNCPLHGGGSPAHGHFIWSAEKRRLGELARFVTRDSCGVMEFDFRNRYSEQEVTARKAQLRDEINKRKEFFETYVKMNPDKEQEARVELKRCVAEYKALKTGSRKVKGVRSVYLPARLFGPSPHVGLTPTQCNLLQTLTLELTRSPASKRDDKAQVVRCGESRIHCRELPVPVCPFLDPDTKYVLFAGNGSKQRPLMHGYGYKVGTWLKRAGYPEEATPAELLVDFGVLAGKFGLVVAAWHNGRREWKRLDELAAMTGNSTGHEWLEACVLRIYTPADYLVRWRQHFADCLGFSCIPGGKDDSVGRHFVGHATINSGSSLAGWMKKNGLSDRELGKRLGVDRMTVNHYKTGRRRWSKTFEEKVASLAGIARHQQGLIQELTTRPLSDTFRSPDATGVIATNY